MPELITQPESVPNPMPGLAKSAPVEVNPTVETAVITPPPEPQPGLTAPSWEGIPVDTIRYFGVEMSKLTNNEIQQLKDIDKWAKGDLSEDSIGNRLQKIRSLESRLGAPALHETRLNKMWNWVKMSFNIDELRKRQAAFEQTSNMRDILR